MQKQLLFKTFLGCTFLLFFSLSKAQLGLNNQISGLQNVCINSSAEYSIDVRGGNYSWSVTSHGSLSNQQGQKTTIYWSVPGIATITVSGTTPINKNFSASYTVYVRPQPNPFITASKIVGCETLHHPENPGGIFLNDGSCTKACAGDRVVYTASGSPGSTYTWSVTGGVIFGTPGTTCTVNWNTSPGQGSVTVTETTQYGCTTTKTYCIEIIPKPHAEFLLTQQMMQTMEACLGQEILFFDQSSSNPSPLINWHWDFGDGLTYSTSTPGNPTHTYEEAGTYTVTLTVKNACNCIDIFTMDIIVNEAPPVVIVCPGVVCENQTATYSFEGGCDDFSWEVVGGTIVNQQGNTVDVVWDNADNGNENGFGYLSLTSNCPDNCPGTTTIKVPVIQQDITIAGPGVICTNQQYLYRMPTWPGTTFEWTLIGPANIVTLLPTDQPNERVVQTQGIAGEFFLKCTYRNELVDCGGETFIEITITKPATLEDPVTTACQGNTVNYSTKNGFTGSWSWKMTRPNGTVANLGSSQSSFSTGTLTLPGIYTIEIVTNSFCPPAPVKLTVVATPPIIQHLTGPQNICNGFTYLYKAGYPVAGSTLKWEAIDIVNNVQNISGSTSGPEASIVFNGVAPYTVKVWRVSNAAPHCSSAVKTLTVSPEVVVPGIAGPSSVCANSYSNYSAAYNRGDEYEWNISPHDAGSVMSGNGTAAVSILWNNTSAGQIATISLRVSKCGVDYFENYTVTINGEPAVNISGNSTVCRGAEYTLSHNAPSGSSFEVDFGNGITQFYPNVTTGTLTYTYPELATPNQSTYNLKIKVTHPLFCVPVSITSSVIVKPSPRSYLLPVQPEKECGLGFSHQVTATVDGTYITPVSLTWTTPLGTQAPCDPNVPACLSQTATSFGGYFVTAEASNGCTSTSNVFEIIEDCEDPYTCLIVPAPQMTTSIDVNECGQIQLTGTSNGINPLWVSPQNVINPLNVVSGSSATFTGLATRAGNHKFDFFSTYFDQNSSQSCIVKISEFVTVPFVAAVAANVACSTGGYQLTLTDNSSQFGAITNKKYFFYINGVLYQYGTADAYSHLSLLGAGSYTVKLVVEYYNNGVGPLYCEQELPLVLPDLPVANYTFTLQNSCEGVPVVFTNTSTNYASSFWDFGDQATNTLNNVERVFQFNNNTPYNVTLTVQNARGCSHDTTKTINIAQNTLAGLNFINANPAVVCSGSISNLQYTNGGSTAPTQYTWVNAGVPFFVGNSPTLTVSQTGYYYVVVSNANKCKATSLPANVIVRNVPDPVIKGSSTQCEGKAFTLDGFVGTDLLYAWYNYGDPSNTVIGTEPQLELNLPNGSYMYVLRVSLPDNSCSKETIPFEVVVNIPPAAPSLTASIIDCNSYQVQLDANTGVPGTYNWSNGDNGSSITVNIGGNYKAWFTDAGGCTSSAETVVPKDPKGYLWVFPTGCYSRCLPPAGEIIINGPIIPFTSWDWPQDGVNGTGMVDPLAITGSGNHSLLLNNGWCDAESGILDLNILNDCENGEECNQLEVQVHDASTDGCTISFDLNLTNNTGTDFTYSISTNVGGTMQQPSGGIIQQGSSTSPVFTWTAPFGITGHGDVIFRVRIWLPGNRYCDKFVTPTEYNCGAGGIAAPITQSKNPKVRNQSAAITKSGITKFLKVAPNPASSIAVVYYSLSQSEAKRQTSNIELQTGSLEVYNMLGVKMYSAPVAGKQGSITLQTANSPAGVYNIILRENGTIIQSTRLIRGR